MAEARYQDALDIAERALETEIDPTERARLHHMAGSAAWRLKRPDASLQHFRNGMTEIANGSDPALLYTLLVDYGLTLYDRGDHEGALVQYERARKNDPGLDPFQTRLLDRRLASLFLDENRFAEANSLLGEAPAEGADFAERFAWTNYKLLHAERTGTIDNAQIHATSIREMWDERGTEIGIKQMSGAMMSALRVDAILGGRESVADALSDLAKLDETSLSANAAARLEIIRARLLHEAGETDTALKTLHTATAHLIDCYGELPLDLVVEYKSMLEESGRADEFFDFFDHLSDGQMSAKTFPVDDLTVEQIPILITLLETAGLKELHVDLFQRGLQKLVVLLFQGLTAEDEWKSAALLARELTHPESRILFAKIACASIVKTASTALTFPNARQTYVSARLAPFELAIALLYDQGRLLEGRTIAALASEVRRRVMAPVRQDTETQELVPWTPAEATARALKPNRLKRLLDGSFWGAQTHTDLGLPNHPMQSDYPILRISKTPDGYLIDISVGDETKVTPVVLDEGTLTSLIVALLDGAELDATIDDVAQALFSALLQDVWHLISPASQIAIFADGVAASIPFLLLKNDMPDVVYLRGTPRMQSRQYRATNDARMLIGDSTLAGTTIESQAIEQVLTSRSDTLSMENLASALAADPDVLHISGHFRVAPGDPSRSALITEVGAFIQLSQITRLLEQTTTAPLLVFLSLCDSAAFDNVGNETVDLPGLFLSSGVEYVIASAWKITDHDAGHFAKAFYFALDHFSDVPTSFHHATRETGFYGFKLFVRQLPKSKLNAHA